MRRALPIIGALCLACTCNKPPLEEVEAEVDAELEQPAPVEPPAAKVTCPQVYPGGEVTPRPLAEWDREAFEATAKDLEMTPDCDDEAASRRNVPGVFGRRCRFSLDSLRPSHVVMMVMMSPCCDDGDDDSML